MFSDNDQGRVYQNFKFHDHRGRVACAGAKCIISSPLLVYTGAWIRQIKNIVMMTKEGSTKIVNFMTPGDVILMIGHISHCSEYASLTSTLSIYSTLIAIVLRAFLCYC